MEQCEYSGGGSRRLILFTQLQHRTQQQHKMYHSVKYVKHIFTLSTVIFFFDKKNQKLILTLKRLCGGAGKIYIFIFFSEINYFLII